MKLEKIIKLKMTIGDPKGVLIPVGIKEELKFEIADGVAVWYFKNSKITKKWADLGIELEKKKGRVLTEFSPRLAKAFTMYPNDTKEIIRDKILENFKQMGLNAKNG